MLKPPRDKSFAPYLNLVQMYKIDNKALRQALRGCSHDGIHWGFQFLSGALGECLVDTGSIALLSANNVDPEDVEVIHRRLVKFTSNGIRAMHEK